ncbi:hypothetical protein BDI4_240034 [Burkholderia diffusa]|nr:hypothetical protein BDI4_240034 [Burkholderia diffusa]
MWLIELKALVGKGLAGFSTGWPESSGRWDNARSVFCLCFILWFPDYPFSIRSCFVFSSMNYFYSKINKIKANVVCR